MQKYFEKIKEKCLTDKRIGRSSLEAFLEIVDEVDAEVFNEEMSEWCTDCGEYDHERHCCPRFCRVIEETVAEIRERREE